MNPSADGLIMFPLFILLAAGSVWFGVYALRNPARVTAYYRRMWGATLADAFYGERAVTFMAVTFLVAAPLLAGFGVYSLVRTLLALN